VALIFYKMSDLGASSEKRFDKLFDSSISYSQRTSGRSVLATGGWYLFLEHPLGVGTGGFSYSYATLDRENIDFHRGRRMQAHSGWIKTLAENGLPGIVLLVSYVWSFALRGWLRRKDGLFLIGLLPSVVLSITFLSTEFQGKGNWFLASAASVLLTRSRWNAATPQRTVRMPLFALRVDQRRIVPV
jgi:O-antigen ligase